VQVADTTQDAWRWKHVKRKTDRDDAFKLVRLALLEQINPVHMPTPAVRQMRALLEYRRGLSAEQTRCKNRIRATLLTVGRRLPAGKTGWSLTAREKLRAEMCPLAECRPEELWRGLVYTELEHLVEVQARLAEVDDKIAHLAHADAAAVRVDTLPGVGPLTALVLVAALDAPRRFRTHRQVAAYAGLVPRRYQSGQMDRSGRITKRGSPLLRWALNQAAWAAVRSSAELRAFYLRVGGANKKRRKQAIVAVMRKLLVIGWALLRDGTCYQAHRLRGRPASAQAA
jgi:transposase